MCIYSFKITNASTKMLKESVSNIPMSFYVECKNNETEQQCFDKISRKFKNKYGIVIESADIEQIDEGIWDKFKAKVAGAAGAVGQSLKNGKTHVTNKAKQLGNALSGAKNAWNDTNTGKTQSTTNLAQKEKRGSTRLAKSNSKLISLLKSQIGDLKHLVKNVNDNFQSLEVNMPDELNKAWETLQQSISAYNEQATAAINDIKGTKNIKSEENAQQQPQQQQDQNAQPQQQPAQQTQQQTQQPQQQASAPQAQPTNDDEKKAQELVNKSVQDSSYTSEGEEAPTKKKKKSTKKNPFAPNPFF